MCGTLIRVLDPPVWMIIMCVFPLYSQFECVWIQMPVDEQKMLQYREFLKCFGALGRIPHI